MADLLARGMNYCKEFIDEYEKLCGRTMTADDLGRVRPYIVCFHKKLRKLYFGSIEGRVGGRKLSLTQAVHHALC